MILGRAPLRISFVGGGTDLEEYHNKYEGHSISYTIDKYTYVIAKYRHDKLFQGFSPDFASHQTPILFQNITPLQGHEILVTCLKQLNFTKGIDVFFCSDVASGSGLGASSSLASNLVNIILTMEGKKWDKNKIALKAYHIAHDALKWEIGKQDEFAAVFGGINFFTFSKDNVSVEPIILKKSAIDEIQNNSMLYFIGSRGRSSDILKIQLRNMKNLNKETMSALHKAKELTLEMRDAFKNNDLTRFAEILKEGWEQKKKYAKPVSNDRINKIINTALKSGAMAAKVTGAGSNGHVFVYADKSKQERITRNLKKFKVKKVDFKYQKTGAVVFDIGDL